MTLIKQLFTGEMAEFHGEFFDFVNAGAAGMINLEDEYDVKLETIPIDVNEDAKSEPFACLV